MYYLYSDQTFLRSLEEEENQPFNQVYIYIVIIIIIMNNRHQ